MISNEKQTDWLDDVAITDIVKAGLPSCLKVRLKIFSLDSNFILDKLGFLVDEDKKAILLKRKKYL